MSTPEAQRRRVDPSPQRTHHYKRYTVTFSCDGIPDVVALLDETPPQIQGGDGGWQVTSRERRIGLTQWRGNDPVRLAVPILFDSAIGWITDQANAMRHLQLMGRPPTINHGEPPILRVVGDGIRYPTSKGEKQDWVMENIQWGTNVMKRDEHFRQDCVVNLLQYIDEDRVAFRNINLPSISPKKKKHHHHHHHHHHKKKQHGWPKWHQVLPGETLPKIAAHYYGDSSMWPRIARANHIRDPRSIHFPQILLIPAP
jgi:hypothetical protein